jgi:hypothetical protein
MDPEHLNMYWGHTETFSHMPNGFGRDRTPRTLNYLGKGGRRLWEFLLIDLKVGGFEIKIRFDSNPSVDSHTEV